MKMKKLIFAIVVLINISTAQPPQFAPPTISFQGILKDTTGNLIADGTYNMTFEIWRLFQGNQEMLWQEIKDVQVVDGLVTTVLGDVAPIIGFPPQGEKVLRIQLGGEILGQHPFTSVPFALYTNTASFSQRSGQSAISDTSLYTLQVPGSIISSLDSLFNLTDSLYSLYEFSGDSSAYADTASFATKADTAIFVQQAQTALIADNTTRYIGSFSGVPTQYATTIFDTTFSGNVLTEYIQGYINYFTSQWNHRITSSVWFGVNGSEDQNISIKGGNVVSGSNAAMAFNPQSMFFFPVKPEYGTQDLRLYITISHGGWGGDSVNGVVWGK